MNELHDEDKIIELVNKKKQMAKDLNMLRIADDLYDDIKDFQNSMKDKSSRWKEVIIEAKCIKDDRYNRIIEFNMSNGNTYNIVYEKEDSPHDIQVHDNYMVRTGYKWFVYSGGKKVLGVLFQCESDNELPFNYYRALDIIAFREGDWIHDFQELHRIQRQYLDGLRKKINEEQIKKLKEDFDV